MRRTVTWLAGLALSIGAAFTSCSDLPTGYRSDPGNPAYPPAPAPRARISISAGDYYSSLPGDTFRLQATAFDSAGHVVPTAIIRWVGSSNPAVATLDSTGKVRAIKKGVALVIASWAGVTDSGSVQVFGTAARLVLEPESGVMVPGAIARINVYQVLDAEGAGTFSRSLSYTSQDSAIARAGGDGTVIAVHAGRTTINIAADSARDSVTIDVRSLAFLAAGAGRSLGCGTAADGSAWCWGAITEQSFSRGYPQPVNAPPFASIGVGLDHACGLEALGAAWCWGTGTSGQLGRGSSGFSSGPPALVQSAAPFRVLSAGATHSCAVSTAGQAYCWGSNIAGEIGATTSDLCFPIFKGTPINCTLRPTLIPALSGPTTIAAGAGHSCATNAAGDAWCWGLNDEGQLGDGSTVNRAAPVPVAGGLHFSTITAGDHFTCALTAGGALYCWGRNSSGQGARPQPIAVSTPTAGGGATAFSQVAAGMNHACAIALDGSAWCWGANTYGQAGASLGTGALFQPTAVAGGLAFRNVKPGDDHSCGVTTSGTAWCWGLADGFNFGDGRAGAFPVPQKVLGQP